MKKKVVIIKYNAGNVQSVEFALQRLGIQPLITDSLADIITADRVIFPGVGHAQSTMQFLTTKGLHKIIPRLENPFLGICLGMQLMCSYSEEGNTECLNIFPQKVLQFKPEARFKVPHMGWNSITNLQSPLFEGIEEGSYVYFVHSYFAELGNDTIATTNYIVPFSAALHKANFYAVQFHPEKSGEVGEAILKNFLNI